MNSPKNLEYLTGFVMGAVFGFTLDVVILVVYNLVCRGLGCRLIGFTWWNAIPLPLLFGILMAIAIGNLGLGDY